jgi:hypothetical protein
MLGLSNSESFCGATVQFILLLREIHDNTMGLSKVKRFYDETLLAVMLLCKFHCILSLCECRGATGINGMRVRASVDCIAPTSMLQGLR